MTALQYTPIEEIAKVRDELKAGFATGKLRSIKYRKYQLAQLMYALHDNAPRFDEALRQDLGRPVLENRFIELFPSITDILTQYNNVQKWSKPEKPPFNLTWTSFRPVIKKEPKGTVLIINAFNYPIWLSFVPLAGAIAAGCTVVIKPSEQTPATSSLVTELFHKYLDNDLVRIVNGGVEETRKLLELQWDHIMYTGSGRIGKIVSEAAVKHLTPVTLELGGKSPVIVDPKCDLKTTARRILWGNVVNSGQTCIAPDYVLVPKDFQDSLVKAFEEVYAEFYPDGDPSKPGVMTHVISSDATARIGNLLANTKGKVVFGGTVNVEARYIAPTLVRDVSSDDSLMSEEIFGPVLPIIPIENLDAAIKFVQDLPNPLVVYLFTQDHELKTKIYTQTRSGAFVVNDTILHPGAEGLPFGGIGPSGYGAYTGKFTFDTFTHLRACLDSPSWIDYILAFRFPPYTNKKLASAMKFVKSLPARPQGPPHEGGWWQKLLALVQLVVRRK